MPMAYASVAFAMLTIIRQTAKASHSVYCDDFTVAGSKPHVLHDQLIVRDIIESTFGPNGRNKKKAVEPCQETDVQGWQFSFTLNLVRPKDRALRKLAFFLFRKDALTAFQPLAYWQGLHSLTERYSHAASALRPFVSAFAAISRKSYNPQRKFQAKPHTRLALEVWRAYSIISCFHPFALSTSIERFAAISLSSTSTLFGISDASTPRVSAAIYDQNDRLLCYSSFLLPWTTTTEVAAKLQNEREYLGLLLVLLLVTTMFPMHNRAAPGALALDWTTDSKVGKSWADKDKCSSMAGVSINIALTFTKLLQNIDLVSTTEVRSQHMGDIDNLSRGRPTPSLDPSCFINMSSIAPIMEFVNPYQTHPVSTSYISIIQSFTSMLHQFTQSRPSIHFSPSRISGPSVRSFKI
jgi:hypothetical protein